MMIKYKCTCGAELECANTEHGARIEWIDAHSDCPKQWQSRQAQIRRGNYPRIHPHPNKLYGVSMVANGLEHADINIQFCGGDTVTIPFIKEYSAYDAFSQLVKLIRETPSDAEQ